MQLTDNTLYGDGNLRAYYKMEGNSVDSKNAYNGSDTAMTYGNGYGKYGQGATFNGSTSKIVLPTNGYTAPTGSFSIATWFKSSGQNLFYSAFYRTGGGERNGIMFGINLPATMGGNGTRLSVFIGAANAGDGPVGDQKAVNGATLCADGVWHHGVAVYDGSTLKVYLDGVEDGTDTWTVNPGYSGTADVAMGAYRSVHTEDSWANFYTGDLDDVVVFDRALSAAEVMGLFKQRFAGGMI